MTDDEYIIRRISHKYPISPSGLRLIIRYLSADIKFKERSRDFKIKFLEGALIISSESGKRPTEVALDFWTDIKKKWF